MTTDAGIGWPLDNNIIRRGMANHTFGMVRRNPDGSHRPHQGWDFFAAPGTKCYAVSDGKIHALKTVGDYGNTIILAFMNDGKPMFAAYSHLKMFSVKVGQTVKRGDLIGLTGNTGNAVSMSGPDCHLHFELRSVASPGRGLSGRYSPLQIFNECPLKTPIRRSVA